MRFALRNRDKLVGSFGEKYYQLLIDSLRQYAETHNELKTYEYMAGREHKYMMFDVPNAQHDSFFQFVITGVMYDVIHVAYFSACG